ncbi:antibiotic biosynthesis monooxygenase family protein [Micromonospora ureilytica]|uniref:antibiotic biosynthesis monooxygenase family protein n=1 Tax=Micromonospora ureilytica TaxID=709868 RepID=UPI0034032390
MPSEEIEVATDGSVTFVNRFTVTAPAEEFERVFAETSTFMTEQDGFVRHTLLRHVEERGRYVNIAVWRDESSLRRAVACPQFQPHAAALRALSTSEPGIYRPLQSRVPEQSR